MTIEEAKAAVGKRVLSFDSGDKMVRPNPGNSRNWRVFWLLHVTKGGMCVLKDRDRQIRPSELRPAYLD